VKLLEKVEQWLRIDNVRAYVVPLDVEVTREVHWLEVVAPAATAAAAAAATAAAGGKERGAAEEEGEGMGRGGGLSAMMGMIQRGGGREGGLGMSRSRSASPLLPLAAALGMGASRGVGFAAAASGAGKSSPTNTSSSNSRPGSGNSATSTSTSTSASTSSTQTRQLYDFKGSAVVQEVVKDFGLTFAAISFSPAVLPTAGSVEAAALARSMGESGEGGREGGMARKIRVSSEETVGKVLLDLPQLDWNLNSRQFYITLDVVRNVLLAPPVMTEEEEEEERVRRQQQEERRLAEARLRAAAAGERGREGGVPERLDLSSRGDREVLKGLVEATLQRLYLPQMELHETKLVQYCVGGGTWKVKAEEGVLTRYDAVEIGFTGFSGQHVYYHEGSMDSTVQVESFWVRNVMPGPDSALFKDDVTTVMAPVVRDKQPCQRCGHAFEEEGNRPGSCVFHGCEDGTPGEFRLMTEEEIERQTAVDQQREAGRGEDVEEEEMDTSVSPVAGVEVAESPGRRPPPPPPPSLNSNSSSLHRHANYHQLKVLPPTTGRWTCCKATYETAPGCRTRAHVAKEVMLSVRAKSNAPLVVAGFEVHPYQFMEVSIFPGADYKLTLQLTRNIVELFHAYFLTQEGEGGREGGRGGGGEGDEVQQTTNLLFGKSVVESKHKAIQEKKGTSLTDRFFNKGLISGASSSSSSSSPRPSPRTGTTPSLSTPTAPAAPPPPPPTPKPDPSSSSSTTTNLEPVIYMRYLRWGDLNVKVSVNGFAVKLDGYRASIPAFVQQGKILNWKRLIRKFEKHVVWSITTSAAASMVGAGGGGGKGKLSASVEGGGGGEGGAGGGGRDGVRLLLSGHSGDEKERGVTTLFSPPPKEDRTKLLFGGK
jgi:hypothetical protein